jgi:hypothetical protein
VPKPRNPYVYYIFTVDEPNELNADETTSMTGTPNDGLNQVDMRLNNGLGDVVSTRKNVHLITYNKSDDVKHSNVQKKLPQSSMETEFLLGHHPFYRYLLFF